MNLKVRPMTKEEIPLMLDYFFNASEAYLRKMGVEPSKLPGRSDWQQTILADFEKPDPERVFFYVAWLEDGKLIGHTNINKIRYGKDAFMHLHVWPEKSRRKGLGTQLVRMSLPLFFKQFKLKKLFCEPNAFNEPPNGTLKKVGFEFLGSEEKVPGYINFHQRANTYVIRWQEVKKFVLLS